MPLPFDMLAVMLFIGYYAETPDAAPPSPGRALAVVLAAVAAMLVFSAGVNAVALRLLRRPRSVASRRSISAHADIILRMALTGLFAAALMESSLPWSLTKHWGLNAGSESFAVQMFGLAPYVLLFFAAWLPMYRLHRDTVPGRWTRRNFLVHKARYNLYMLIAWVPFAFLADWLGEFMVTLPFLFLAAAWAFPYLLARAWGCRRLPEGEIADSIRRLEDKAGVRFSRVYLWEPGGGSVQNAAAVGIFPPFRYLFLTPALVRGMNADELEAVILHELGHVERKHLLFYLFTSLAGINFAVLAGLMLPLAPAERFILTVAMVLFYFRFVFGWLSRNMERQADLFSLEKSGSSRGLVNALEKLGLAAGNVRLASSWHHLGIAERVDWLRNAERHPILVRAHNAKVRRLMAGGYMLSFLLIAGMVWMVATDLSVPASGPQSPVSAREDQAHWRRVTRLMPDDAEAALELAHRLARDAAGRDEAFALAMKARNLAGSGETRDAADKLLRDLRE